LKKFNLSSGVVLCVMLTGLVATGCGKDEAKPTGATATTAGAKGAATAKANGKKLHKWGPDCTALFKAYDKACPKGNTEAKCRGWKFTVDDLRKRPEGHKHNAMSEQKGCSMVKGQIDAFLKEKGK